MICLNSQPNPIRANVVSDNSIEVLVKWCDNNQNRERERDIMKLIRE